MILIDAGPLIALFDARDQHHDRCVDTLATIDERLITTSPVLTEAFYMLEGTRGAATLRQFIRNSGISTWALDDERLLRALDLMEAYEHQAMDLADASLVAAAESMRITTVFTLDRSDFTVYRPRIGRQLSRFRLLP